MLTNINDKLLGNREKGKILENAILMGQHKNKAFLARLLDLKWLRFMGTSSSNIEQVKEDFFKLIDIFEEKYKDLADLSFYYDDMGQYVPYFKVFYPRVEITNSQGHHHVIKDLFIIHEFRFDHGHLHPYVVQGGRFSKNELEILAGYQQSHLPSDKDWLLTPFRTSKFCIGGDTDVSSMIAEFEIEMDFDRYELFLFCVDSMVTWESLEGVPYIRMSTIETAGNDRVSNASAEVAKRLAMRIIELKIPLELDFYVENGRYRITPNSKASDFIKDFAIEKEPYRSYSSYVVTRVPNTFDQFLKIKTEAVVAKIKFHSSVKQFYTIFRGRKVYPKIIRKNKLLTLKVDENEHIIHPKFLAHVLKEFESRIYQKAVIFSGTRLFNTTNNATTNPTSDSIPV